MLFNILYECPSSPLPWWLCHQCYEYIIFVTVLGGYFYFVCFVVLLPVLLLCLLVVTCLLMVTCIDCAHLKPIQSLSLFPQAPLPCQFFQLVSLVLVSLSIEYFCVLCRFYSLSFGFQFLNVFCGFTPC